MDIVIKATYDVGDIIELVERHHIGLFGVPPDDHMWQTTEQFGQYHVVAKKVPDEPDEKVGRDEAIDVPPVRADVPCSASATYPDTPVDNLF